MNKKILLLLLFLSTLACSSKPEKPIPEKQLEGWAGNPDNPNEKPFDYFYMHMAGRASQKAIDKKSGAMMEMTCKNLATTNIKRDLIGKMIYESVQLDYTFNSKEQFSYLIETHKDLFANSFNAINLAAISDRDPPYSAIVLVKEYLGKINEIKVKDCQSIGIPDPEVPFSEWKECECIVYVYIKGGRDTIITRAREIDGN